MKKKLLGFVSLMLFGATAATAANWFFDPDADTMTDGVWTFTNVTATATDLTVGPCVGCPDEFSTLDFSKPVTNAAGTSFTIDSLGALFGKTTNNWRPKSVTTTTGMNLRELVLPATGLTSIGEGAFGGCVNLTNVVNFLPDSVTTLGAGAFHSVKARQSLVLRGAVTLSQACFYDSSITDVTFGSALKTLQGNYERGCFGSCKELTTVNFDPAMSEGAISGESVFAYCSKLTGTIDFSGFTSLGSRPFYDYKGDIKKLILSSSLTYISDSFLHSMDSLDVIEFTAGPPAITGTSLYRIYNYTTKTSLYDLYTVVPEAYKDDWAQYCENGEINALDSHWDSALVPDAYSKNLFLVHMSDSGGELGDWVYDGTTVESTRQGWKFNASLNGIKALTVGAWVSHPSTVSELDFSTSVTDTNGNWLAFVNVSPAFGYANGKTRVDYIEPTSAAGYVGRLVLPESWLHTIGGYAFSMCTNLAEVTPFLPDSVKVVGDYAFQGVPQTTGQKDLRLYSISSIERGVFYGVPITSVVFGPDLKRLSCNWLNAAFLDCATLTNIVFDPAMSGGYLDGTTYGPFQGCHNVGKLDLSGFDSLAFHFNKDTGIYSGSFGSMEGVGEIIVGPNFSLLGHTIFNNMPALTNVTFKGVPPASLETPYLDGQSATKKVTTCIYRAQKSITNSTGKCWLDYAADGDIRGRDTTWAAAYLVDGIDPAFRPLVTVEPDVGTCFILR